MGPEVFFHMDLKNNKVTVGELLDYAPAKAIFQRRFPMVMRSPLVGASRTVTLEQLISIARPHVSQKVINDTLNELRRA